MLDISWLLLLAAALVVAATAVRMVRAPWSLAREWWLVLAVVVAGGGACYLAAPRWAGHVAFALAVLLVVLPLRLDAASSRASFRGDDARAVRLATLARLVHPLGVVGHRARSLAAAARVRDGAPLDAATLRELGAVGDPVIAEAYRLVALSAAGEHLALCEALALPARRHRFLSLGLGTVWLRAVAATSSPETVMEALTEIERHDQTLRDFERRATLTVEACAALGDVQNVEMLASILRARRPPGTFERALAQAQRAAGDRVAARATIDAALARTDLRPAQRRALELLSRPTARERELQLAPVRDPAVRARIDRLVAEVVAGLALEPLAGESPALPWLTYGLSLALVAAHLARGGDDGAHGPIADALGLRLPITGFGETPRLFTYAFVHVGWEHLLLNVAGLVLFGRFVESFFGRTRTIAIWLVASAAGGLGASHFAAPDAHAMLEGASGAIFGLGGALLAALALRADLRRSRRGRQELVSLLVLFAVQSIVDRLVPQISGAAHACGLLGGLVTAAVLLPRAASAAPARGSG